MKEGGAGKGVARGCVGGREPVPIGSAPFGSVRFGVSRACQGTPKLALCHTEIIDLLFVCICGIRVISFRLFFSFWTGFGGIAQPGRDGGGLPPHAPQERGA